VEVINPATEAYKRRLPEIARAISDEMGAPMRLAMAAQAPALARGARWCSSRAKSRRRARCCELLKVKAAMGYAG